MLILLVSFLWFVLLLRMIYSFYTKKTSKEFEKAKALGLRLIKIRDLPFKMHYPKILTGLVYAHDDGIHYFVEVNLFGISFYSIFIRNPGINIPPVDITNLNSLSSTKNEIVYSKNKLFPDLSHLKMKTNDSSQLINNLSKETRTYLANIPKWVNSIVITDDSIGVVVSPDSSNKKVNAIDTLSLIPKAKEVFDALGVNQQNLEKISHAPGESTNKSASFKDNIGQKIMGFFVNTLIQTLMFFSLAVFFIVSLNLLMIWGINIPSFLIYDNSNLSQVWDLLLLLFNWFSFIFIFFGIVSLILEAFGKKIEISKDFMIILMNIFSLPFVIYVLLIPTLYSSAEMFMLISIWNITYFFGCGSILFAFIISLIWSYEMHQF
jgi:hypothetical protein